MQSLDLCSGIGGMALGLKWAGIETKAFCEIDPYCRRVLRKHWPDLPIYEDIKKLREEDVGSVDLVAAGWPCQPFSLAGDRRGTEDDRYLWPEVRRLVEELRPRWFLGENVAHYIELGLDICLSNLEALGYTARPFVVPAVALDARHRRARVWIVAHTPWDEQGWRTEQRAQRERARSGGQPEPLANAAGAGPAHHRQDQEGGRFAGWDFFGGGGLREPADCQPARWEPEPGVGRVATGVPNRVDRLKGLGNSVVPQVVEILGRAIMEADDEAISSGGSEESVVEDVL